MGHHKTTDGVEYGTQLRLKLAKEDLNTSAIKFEHTEVFGFNAALRGMRNAKNSWHLSDSKMTEAGYKIGSADMQLASALVNAGSDHSKFLRMIHVQVDLTFSRYIWTELDTYKVATVRNSCSTMHKILSREIVNEDFIDDPPPYYLDFLNTLRKDNQLRLVKSYLPEGYLQKATYDVNYETLVKIYHSRKNHRLPEWKLVCNWIEHLPYLNIWLHLRKN